MLAVELLSAFFIAAKLRLRDLAVSHLSHYKIAMLVVSLPLLSLDVLAQGLGSQWLSPWQNRVPVTVTNSGPSLSQFQIKIALGSSFNFSAANSDGSDLRITASDGATLIPMWLQSWSPQQNSATMWTKVPSIPSTGTTLYLYYGNSSATSASSGDSTFDFFDDFSYVSTAIPISTSIGKAVSWIQRAQDANAPLGGVSYFFDTGLDQWNGQDYQEVTGYIIPTIYDTAKASTDPTVQANLRARAKKMADWEVSVQASNGSFQFVFDTGQVIEGLVRAYQETGSTVYLTAATRAGDWLVGQQSSDGTWPNDFNSFPHAYHSRVDRNLLYLWQVTGNSNYFNAAVKNLDWVVAQQQPNGWFADAGIAQSENSNPLTHTISYTTEGLLDSGLTINTVTGGTSGNTYINAAKKAADALLLRQNPNGSLTGGNYFSDWTPAVADQCLTGSAQTAIVWMKLYKHSADQGSPNKTYLNAAMQLNQYLLSVQGNSSDPGIDGGLPGSDPISGNYMPNLVLSWATKFLIDSLNLEVKLVPNAATTVYGFDPTKWSFPDGQSGFSNPGGVLQYNGTSRARVQAMKGGTTVNFSNGIVEYEVQSTVDYGEMGLMYRGQIPETTNSYVFFPSTWSSLNRWSLYGLESGVETFIGGGGAFSLGQWYNVKAAINGSSHSFWINGNSVLTTQDATFSSGTLGLMAWNSTTSQVAHYRLRQYAAAEPRTAVGAEQVANPGVTSVGLNPTTVAGGSSSVLTVSVNFSTGGNVNLASSNPSIAPVPSFVTIQPGSKMATVTITTAAVTSSTVATISASYATTSMSAALTVTPALNSLQLTPSSVVGGNASTGTVTLTGPAPTNGILVALTSGNPSIAAVPANATIPQGQTSTSFQIATSGVSTSSSALITASYSNSNVSNTLSVTAPSIASVSVSPASVSGGDIVSGVVTLSGAAPASGAVVNLSSNNTAVATVPTSVTIPSGSSQASFNVTTNNPSSSTVVSISGSYTGSTQSAALTVNSLSTNWVYRRLVNIANTAGTALSTFQVLVALDSSFNFAHAQSNGSDLRITASDGFTILPFWIQNWNASASTASIWVQIPSIPTTGTSIYLYYGNAAAASTSNGNTTFDFFDDFSYKSGGAPAIDPSKWSFPAGQIGFSNTGGTLQYSNPSGSFGPRAIATKNGANFNFSNGVVEYSLQSSAGFGEMGLVYRGQNPETANSYVFYPSTYNSQNTWLLYARSSNGGIRLGSGGAFALGVTYAVKAAIGSTSYSFSINGNPVFTVANSLFSTGSVGVLAWGGTVSSVTNFRIRKFAAADPSASVGSEQPSH